MHVWIYYTFNYIGSFLRSRFSKFIFTELLKAFWLIQQFHARQMAVSVPGPPLRTWSGGWGRQVWGWVSLWNSLTMKDFCGLLWSTWIFLMKLFPGTRCPQTLKLSASSANHSLPLTSFLATRGPCLVWGGRFLSSKSWSGCSCFNEHHAAFVPGQGGGLRNLDRTWNGAPCPHTCHFQLHVAAGPVLLFSLILWPLAHSCQKWPRGGDKYGGQEMSGVCLSLNVHYVTWTYSSDVLEISLWMI